jgi:predicted enzyme related to lactoylglutathione lyase
MSDIGFVLLYVEDVARSAAFYSHHLEKPIVESSGNFAMIPVAPGLMLGLWRRSEVAPKAAGGPGAAEIAVTLADAAAVEAAHVRWSAQGTPIAQSPTAMDFGYTFVALDPDGHRLRVFAPASA